MRKHGIEKNSYSKLERLNLEQLQSLLQEDFDNSDDVDMDYISTILEIIKQRELENNEPLEFDAETGWQDFEDNYMNSKPANIIDISEIPKPTRTRRRLKVWQTVAAAVVVTMLGGFITAQAFGYNIFNIFTSWTDDSFMVSNRHIEPTADLELIEIPPDMEFETLLDVFDYIDIHERVIPSWIPEGFIQTHLIIHQLLPEQTIVDVTYEKEDGIIRLGFVIHSDKSEVSTSYYIKDDTPVQEYVIWGITHYLFSNGSYNVAVWFNNNVESSISGQISEEEIIKMIHSIYGE